MTILSTPSTRTDTGLSFDCADPLMVRAELLIIGETRQGSAPLGALVDGVMIDMGLISTALLAELEQRAEPHATLRAAHFAGGTVARKVPVIRG